MKKFFSYALQLAVVVLLSVSFSGCSEEENDQTMIYSAGFETFSSSSSGTTITSPVVTLKEIEDIFFAELGVTSSPFTMEGTASVCDAQVKAACERAVARLKQQTWNMQFVYVVNNAITEQTVFRYVYPE